MTLISPFHAAATSTEVLIPARPNAVRSARFKPIFRSVTHGTSKLRDSLYFSYENGVSVRCTCHIAQHRRRATALAAFFMPPFGWRRAIAYPQFPNASLCRATRRKPACANATCNRLFPRRRMLSVTFPALIFNDGSDPQYAPTCLLWAKRRGSPTSHSQTTAVISPTPGTLCRSSRSLAPSHSPMWDGQLLDLMNLMASRWKESACSTALSKFVINPAMTDLTSSPNPSGHTPGTLGLRPEIRSSAIARPWESINLHEAP